MATRIVYRVKNNPDARGFYAAAYSSHPTELSGMRELRLIEKVCAGTKRAAERADADLRAKYGDHLSD